MFFFSNSGFVYIAVSDNLWSITTLKLNDLKQLLLTFKILLVNWDQLTGSHSALMGFQLHRGCGWSYLELQPTRTSKMASPLISVKLSAFPCSSLSKRKAQTFDMVARSFSRQEAEPLGLLRVMTGDGMPSLQPYSNGQADRKSI